MDTCSLPAFDRASIDTFISAMATAPSPGCMLVTHEFKGAATRIAPDATAFTLRREHVLIEIVVGSDGQLAVKNRAIEPDPSNIRSRAQLIKRSRRWTLRLVKTPRRESLLCCLVQAPSPANRFA
jgi:hypothetical protein